MRVTVDSSRVNLPADKGHENGSCNRTQCLAPGANCYNPHTCAYYCVPCALDINVWLKRDGLKLIDIPDEYATMVK